MSIRSTSTAPPEINMPDAQLQTLVKIFDGAFAALHVSVPESRTLSLAETIRRAMTAHTRFYHTLDHIFVFIDPHDPVRTLAAMYHDVVYYQVDQKFTEEIERLVRPYIHLHTDESVHIADHIPPQDRMIGMALQLRQHLGVGALNEFLSAVVMLRTGGVCRRKTTRADYDDDRGEYSLQEGG
jgi:hypothetical protein